MSCTPCGRTIPDIIKLARTEPKLYHCPECMSVWLPSELAPANALGIPECQECGLDPLDNAGLEEI